MAKKKERLEEDSALPDTEKNAPGGKAPAAAPQQGDTSPMPEAAVTPESRIKALEEESSDLKDKLLRKQADFENFRKRMIREREEAARYANAALLSDLIGLIDDFERAIRSAEESRDFPGFLAGVSMIEKQLVETLDTRWGLKRFTSIGETFDPNKHEAVLRVEGPADAKPTVVEDYQKGYYFHERVLRPAKVKVMVPASTQSADAPAAEGKGGSSGDGVGHDGAADEKPPREGLAGGSGA